jgi:hypothetical protein
MLVNRLTRIVKNGCMQKAIDLVQAEIERAGAPDATRICTAYAGPTGVMIIEHEFSDIGELDQYWKTWFADPESAAFREAFGKLTKPGGANEIWNLHE